MLIYRLLLIVLTPVVALRFAWALLRGRETLAGLKQRIGLCARPAPGERIVWIHGASLGELTAARALIDRLLQRTDSGLALLVTCNSHSARAMALGWSLPRVHVCLAPLDAPLIVRLFLSRWRPMAMITLENELWPARTIIAARQAIPVIVVAGRLSQRSAAMWKRTGPLARRVMGAISLVLPMDRENGARYLELGLSTARLGEPVNLKGGVRLAPPEPAQLQRLQRVFRRADTILAASTHTGEDEIVLRAFAQAHRANGALRLILAPRHPERAAAVARMIDETGLRWSLRSADPDAAQQPTVYLADTLGEMALFYSLAAMTFVGASLVPRGGHTPVEPVQFASAVVHGPHVENHALAYGALAEAGACIAVEDADGLRAAFAALPAPERLCAMADAAGTALARMAGPPDGGQAPADAVVAQLARLVRNRLPLKNRERTGRH